MTHQPGTPEQRSAAGSAPDPAPAGGESPVGEGPEGRPDSRRVWLDRTDALFEDLPGSGSPAAPTSMSPYGAPPAGPVPPAPPPRRVGSSVAWPSIDAASAGLERPDWDQWRRYQDQDQPTEPLPGRSTPYTPQGPSKAASQPGALARRAAGSAKRLGGPGWVPVVVMAAVMVMSFGVRPYGGGYPGHFHDGPPGAFGMNQLGDAYGLENAASVTPIGADAVTAPMDPGTVRLELVAASGTKATVTYGSDGRDTQRAKDVSLPWAVEAPLTADNNSISVTGAQESSAATTATKASLTCRVYLDGVLVNEERSRGMAACTTKLDGFRSGAPGQGAALSRVTQAEPSSTVMPALPTAGAKVTFEAYSSDGTDALDVDFGPPGTRAGAHREHQPAPSAWQASVTKNVGLLTLRVRQDGPPRATSTLMCRILVDDVVVAQSLNAGPVGCSTSVGDVIGA